MTVNFVHNHYTNYKEHSKIPKYPKFTCKRLDCKTWLKGAVAVLGRIVIDMICSSLKCNCIRSSTVRWTAPETLLIVLVFWAVEFMTCLFICCWSSVLRAVVRRVGKQQRNIRLASLWSVVEDDDEACAAVWLRHSELFPNSWCNAFACCLSSWRLDRISKMENERLNFLATLSPWAKKTRCANAVCCGLPLSQLGVRRSSFKRDLTECLQQYLNKRMNKRIDRDQRRYINGEVWKTRRIWRQWKAKCTQFHKHKSLPSVFWSTPDWLPRRNPTNFSTCLRERDQK